MFFVTRILYRIAIAILAFIARQLVGSDRFVIQDPKTQVADLTECILMLNCKLEKRLRRLEIMATLYYNERLISVFKYNAGLRLIAKKRLEMANQRINVQAVDLSKIWDPSPDFFEATGLFDQQPTDPKVLFKQHASSVYNASGFVYMTTLYLSQIAYACFLMQMWFSYECDWKLVKTSKLMSKGGISCGYTLLKYAKGQHLRNEITTLFLGLTTMLLLS